MIEITDFNTPDKHPNSMLGDRGAHEKESFLVFLLTKHIENGNWNYVQCEFLHPELESLKLIEYKGEGTEYRLTAKAKGLLYGFYSKESE